MATRGFYLVSAALLGGSAVLLWLVLGDSPSPASDASTAAGTAATADDRALGVGGADYDPARGPVGGATATNRSEPDALAQTFTAVAERPARPPAAVMPPEPPVAGGPGLAAASEASAAARPRVLEAVRADLEARRDALRQACWPPGSDFGATFTVEATYAADGAMLTLGVSDVPGMPGVGACLMGQLAQTPPALAGPPGADVTVAVPVVFAGAERPPEPSPRAFGGSPGEGR
ncbi:hypothetical protein SAMN02745121_06812 [Nannocystis exedens]|uniref:Uncharacterized protein n=1 Tax=Nannocystis exedens TaxID=54 RepID=A0A1I2FUP8_9BACT|nr:hypothetical protein [Nannocystis exedens]PCC73693.1 hypothetical protein NAEX_06781 [Nannocystis exedens]SFF08236.1 hypothetical protein SAMN02745121_06812 [Nannocystis exedens]